MSTGRREITDMSERRQRLLIFVIAYHAETTLGSVLDRIPGEVFDHYDCEVLVVDDASTDRTFEIGRQYRDEHPEVPLTVLRNRYNQGYGGNQKIGYAYAISSGFDLVAMVHGDGQYAPEELPRLLEPLANDEADAVMGSRMMTPGAARAGGMPLYKFVGNKILTRIQNALLGTSLSEFHSGYRIYSTAALQRLHYEINSNDFHFDTEIIIQLLNADLRVLELPIPTYYGDEISRVNGIAYAANVVLVTLKNWLHRSGLLYQRRLDPKVVDNAHYDLKLGYASSHEWALRAVPEGATVMDIGSGPGGLAAELVKKGCATAVVDLYPPAGSPSEVEVFVQDLDQELEFDTGPYDHLLLLDVIEHLKAPELFLERLRRQFGYEKKRVVFSTPNVAFVVQRLTLAFGQFNYGKSGILDQTHTRLFTFRTFRRLLRDAGFRVVEVRGVPAPFPKALGDNAIARVMLALNMGLIRLSKTLFSYQIFVVAESTPDLQFLVADGRSYSSD